MEKLSEQNKIDILDTLLIIIQKDHPEFQEEHTTGWDVIENAKIWLEELKAKGFHNWLEQFIKESGHSFGMGFYFELKTGEVFYNGTDEYKQWYDGKLEEYKTKH